MPTKVEPPKLDISMPVLRFFAKRDDLVALCNWVGAQADLAVLALTADGKWVATRNYAWTFPDRVLLWYSDGDPVESLGELDYEIVANPWIPFAARDIYVDKSIFEMRLRLDDSKGAIGPSWVNWRGGGSPNNLRLWKRLRKRLTSGATQLERIDGQWCYALPSAAAAIACGKPYSVVEW
ncbi:MAG TPA: hypothetical protein VFK05_32330 [Polyangiaceae bacterium]|nr:hypothetical protein [Polyangiaceae bacterium]